MGVPADKFPALQISWQVGFAFLSQCRTLVMYGRTLITPWGERWSLWKWKISRAALLDSSPQRSMDGGFADQRMPVLCPHSEQSHQLTDFQLPSAPPFLNLSLRGCEISSCFPSKNAIEKQDQHPQLEKPFRLWVPKRGWHCLVLHEMVQIVSKSHSGQPPSPKISLLSHLVLPEHPSSHFPPPTKTLQPILAFRIHLFSTTTSSVFSYDYLAFFPSLLHALHRSTQQNAPSHKKNPWSPRKRKKTGWKYLCANTFVQIAFFSNRQMACNAKVFYFYGIKRYPWNVFLNLEFLNWNQPHVRIYWGFCQTVLLLSYFLCK